MNLKELAQQPIRFTHGHRACAGCAFPLIVRYVLAASKEPVVVIAATGCLEVVSTIYPYTAWNVPFIHNAFENAAATASGIETAFKALKKKHAVPENINFVAFGGDGGTYDIGLQALSGAWERGHRFVYICYDNEAYMNTGIQRSSATPFAASTTTDPAGKIKPGKEEIRKDLTAIAVAHHIPYVAQTSVSHATDVIAKAEKAFATPGPAFLNILSPCPPGWGYDTRLTIDIAKKAVATNFWPLYEVIDGNYSQPFPNPQPLPVEEFLKLQRRFNHIFKPHNQHLIKQIQQQVDRAWYQLQEKAKKILP